MANNYNRNYIGQFIKENRKKLGLSVRDLAKRTGLSATSISSYETGTRFPKLEPINKLASAFNVSPQLLMGPGDIGNRLSEDAESYNFLSFLKYIGFEIEYDNSQNGVVLLNKSDSIWYANDYYVSFPDLFEIENLVSDFAINLVFTKGLITEES